MNTIEHLEKFGYAIEENVLSKEECEKMTNALDRLEKEQEQNGTLYSNDSQTVLFNIHLENPELFMDKIDIDSIMKTLNEIFQDKFTLSNFNASKSGKKGGNRIHIDSRIPITNFQNTIQVAVLLCLDDFTEKNGGTIVWPFSHKSDLDPRHVRDKIGVKGGIVAKAPRGSVIYTLGQTWHDVGPNLDQSRRWGIIAYYARWWIKPTFDFTRCGEEIFSKLNNQQKELLGFTTKPPTDAKIRQQTVISVEDLPREYEKNLKL